MKKFNALTFGTYALLGVTVVLLVVTGYLVYLTKELRESTGVSVEISNEAAKDIDASRVSLSNVETGISNLVTALTANDSPLIEQLTGIKGDTEVTKEALVNNKDGIKDNIDNITRDVKTIKGQVDKIEGLLAPPSETPSSD